VLRQKLAGLLIRVEAMKYHSLRQLTDALKGRSPGIAASINKLVGRADYINELSDFAGTYSVVGAGGALIGGVGGAQLKNDKGVVITLQGPKGGLEVSANVTKVVITLDQTGSSPN